MMLLDAIIVFMLLVTIAYCWQLNRKIVQLQKGKSEFAKLFRNFDNSLLRAEQDMRSLKEQTQNMAASLGRKTELAKELIDDLSDLENKGRRVYQSLEMVLAEAKEQQEALEITANKYPINNRFHEIEASMPSAANRQVPAKVAEPMARPTIEDNRGNLAREIQQVFAARAQEEPSNDEDQYLKDKRVPYRPTRETDQHKQAIESLLRKISEVNRK